MGGIFDTFLFLRGARSAGFPGIAARGIAFFAADDLLFPPYFDLIRFARRGRVPPEITGL